MDAMPRADAAAALATVDRVSSATARTQSFPLMLLYIALGGPLAVVSAVVPYATGTATLVPLMSAGLVAMAGGLLVYLVVARGWKRGAGLRFGLTLGALMAAFVISVAITANGGPAWFGLVGAVGITLIASLGSLAEWRAGQ